MKDCAATVQEQRDIAEARADRLAEALRVVRDANTIMRAKLEANRALAEIEKEEARRGKS